MVDLLLLSKPMSTNHKFRRALGSSMIGRIENSGSSARTSPQAELFSLFEDHQSACETILLPSAILSFVAVTRLKSAGGLTLAQPPVYFSWRQLWLLAGSATLSL